MGGDAAGDILYYNGTDYQKLGIGTTGQHLATNSAVNAPEWVDALPAVGADGNVLTSDGTNWASEASTSGMITQQLYTHQSEATVFTGAQDRTGTWTKPSGVKQIEVHVKGGGNHGASSLTGDPGMSGGFVLGILDVRDITSLDWRVGIFGTMTHGAGSDQRNTGNASCFGSHSSLPTGALNVTVNNSGAITAISGSGGSGITLPPVIVILHNSASVTGRDGTGATATANISGGAVTGITITNGGSGYVQGAVTAFFGYTGLGGVGYSATVGAHRGTQTISENWFGQISAPYGGGNMNSPVGDQGNGGAANAPNGNPGSPGGIYIKEYR
jgi:hypothetical protein